MKTVGIGEAARLLGVRPHVLRYWESELPMLAPRKGRSGRREYSAQDLQLLLRLKHLLYERRYTLEGARQELWEELGSPHPDLRARLDAVRSDLVEALMLIQGRSGEPVAKHDPRDVFEALEQGHLFAHWDARPRQMRRRLAEDLAALDPGLVGSLVGRLAEGPTRPARIEPVAHVSLREIAADREARGIGEELIASGRTAFLTVAGGQGSRLGFDGPKGLFPVTPMRRLPLFAFFAEKLLAARRRYGAAIPWLIMTSRGNHEDTRSAFERADWFGLGAGTVRFFTQGMLPALSPEGRLLLAADGGLFWSPNGHGGVIEGLRSSGLLGELAAAGVEELFHFQVDNPLVTVPDPVFLGFHRRAGSDISSKVVEKSHRGEKLGAISTIDGRPGVIEYSDLSDALSNARDGQGRLLFAQGSIAIHVLRAGFLAREGLSLPLHLVRKPVRALIPKPDGADTENREAVKFEMFIFDAIPLADRSLFFEVDRAEEFAPLKNREGPDSIETCLRGQVEKAARWLETCGIAVPRGDDGRPRSLLEISPLFALDRGELAAKRGALPDRIDADTLLA
ncbi:MAG: UTP--glucose-1-phosphate uridylyltransferase [Spirochaetes bacterium]|nr:UTP--glucose-1-phosphate uridylyltransferase [Spirochaetota bacterium]